MHITDTKRSIGILCISFENDFIASKECCFSVVANGLAKPNRPSRPARPSKPSRPSNRNSGRNCEY